MEGELPGGLDEGVRLRPEQPDVGGEQATQDEEHDRWPEQGLKCRGDRPMEAGGDDLGPKAQGQQGLRTEESLVSNLSRSEQPERLEPVLDQEADVVGDDGATELFACARSHALEVPLAVERQQDQVEQVGQVDDLAIATTDQVVRLFVSRALVLSQQFGALGQPQRTARRRRRCGLDTCCSGGSTTRAIRTTPCDGVRGVTRRSPPSAPGSDENPLLEDPSQVAVAVEVAVEPRKR